MLHSISPRVARFAALPLLLVFAWGHLYLRAQSRPQSAKTQVASGDPSSEIRAVLTEQQSAWNHGDIPAFLEGYWNSPELTFAGSDGIVRGYDGLLDRYRKTYSDKARMGELEFSGLEIHPLGADSALVLGHWHLKRTVGDAGGVFSLVFHRFPVGWRIIHDHTSVQKLTPEWTGECRVMRLKTLGLTLKP
jgi:ketosteroid isomerase-like protein